MSFVRKEALLELLTVYADDFGILADTEEGLPRRVVERRKHYGGSQSKGKGNRRHGVHTRSLSRRTYFRYVERYTETSKAINILELNDQ